MSSPKPGTDLDGLNPNSAEPSTLTTQWPYSHLAQSAKELNLDSVVGQAKQDLITSLKDKKSDDIPNMSTDKLVAEIDKLTGTLAIAPKLGALVSELRNRAKTAQKMDADVNEVHVELGQVRAEINVLHETCQAQGTEILSLQSVNEEMKNENSALLRQREELISETQTVNEMCNKLIEEKEDWRSIRRELESTIEYQNSSIDNLKLQLRKRAEIDEKNKTAKLVAKQEKEIEKLRQQLEAKKITSPSRPRPRPMMVKGQPEKGAEEDYRVPCANCGKLGHMAQACYHLVGFPPRGTGRRAAPKPEVSALEANQQAFEKSTQTDVNIETSLRAAPPVTSAEKTNKESARQKEKQRVAAARVARKDNKKEAKALKSLSGDDISRPGWFTTFKSTMAEQLLSVIPTDGSIILEEPTIDFDIRQLLKKSANFPSLELRREVYCGHQYEEFVPSPGQHTKQVYEIEEYYKVVAMLAPSLCHLPLVDPVNTFDIDPDHSISIEQHENDHYRCMTQGDPIRRKYHLCEHEGYCNQETCALFDIVQIQQRLERNGKLYLVHLDFPSTWLNIFVGLWIVDADQQVMLELLPPFANIIIEFNDRAETAVLSEQQKMLIKALNYDIVFIDIDTGFDFVFLMAVQRILRSLKPEAISNFAKQIMQYYGAQYGDLRKIFHKLCDKAKWDIEAVALHPRKHQDKLQFLDKLDFNKITSIMIHEPDNEFDYAEHRKIEVHNEVVFCIDSKCPRLLRTCLIWFGKKNQDLFKPETVDSQPRVTTEATLADRKSKILTRTRARSLIRLAKPTAAAVHQIIWSIMNYTEIVNEVDDYFEIDCRELDHVPIEFWMQKGKTFKDAVEEHLAKIGSQFRDFCSGYNEAESMRTFFLKMFDEMRAATSADVDVVTRRAKLARKAALKNYIKELARRCVLYNVKDAVKLISTSSFPYVLNMHLPTRKIVPFLVPAIHECPRNPENRKVVKHIYAHYEPEGDNPYLENLADIDSASGYVPDTPERWLDDDEIDDIGEIPASQRQRLGLDYERKLSQRMSQMSSQSPAKKRAKPDSATQSSEESVIFLQCVAGARRVIDVDNIKKEADSEPSPSTSRARTN
ncbi:hypothetical protein HDE_03644 [Halotydeus destructor]|nr:hypothetical protein HDE_03644 [Halotydeus destructor]